ncbi:MAG: cobyrinate a,c-diamide synthase [Nocardioidaceae bacterium]
MRLPRLVVAAPASGHGKTTVATGLMAALRAAGHVVSGHKVGPDYIDPGYHALATGRPGRNLDPHLVGVDRLAPLLVHGAGTPVPADLAVVEGVMGLYDGALGRHGFASTAQVAAEIGAPVVLVVDVSHQARSVGAVVHGMATFDPSVRVAGVVLNKAGSARHAAEATAAVEDLGLPVLGVLHRDDGISAPARHLGLVPAAERADAARALDRLAAQVARRVDLAAVLTIAASAPDLDAAPWDPAAALGAAARPPDEDAPLVAVAGGRAFTFRYAETGELLCAAGLRTAVFDPLRDDRLPAGTAGIYLGGGFPEVHAGALGANTAMLRAVRAAVRAGVPTVAECAGLLYLCTAVDGEPLVGALDATGAMTPGLTLGYRTAVSPADTLLTRAGDRVTGHEFHRTTVLPGTAGTPAWTVGDEPAGFSLDPAGLGRPTLHASYLHLHWAGHPTVAARFAAAVRTAHEHGLHRLGNEAPPDHPAEAHPAPLDHHGDREVGPGLVDLAVNVYQGPRPGWLDEALRDSLAHLGGYPDTGQARQALARRHGRAPEEVLPTAGGAEAFTLVARMRRWRRPVVVHPQFTEPEAALRAAGHRVHRVLLEEHDGFALHPHAVPEDADLVVLGNPCNPTGRLTDRGTVEALLRPGRTVLVDEAFMDAVPGERASLAGRRTAGLVVVRSLTKTWSIPGVRAGYLLADPGTVTALARQQPPWSVSGTAAAAMVACSTDAARAEAERRAREGAGHRAVLREGLAAHGLPVTGHPATPFVLVRVPPSLRAELRARGFAVRRGDTFPGLGPGWVRIAVRDPETTGALLAAVEDCRRAALVPR